MAHSDAKQDMAMMKKFFANNTPVGSAGQPQGKLKNPSKAEAIQRRLKKAKDTGKK